MVDLAIVSELFATYAAPVPWLGHALATVATVLGGSEPQKPRSLTRLAPGSVLATVPFPEGTGVWLPGQWQLAGPDGRLTDRTPLTAHRTAAQRMLVGPARGRAPVQKV